MPWIWLGAHTNVVWLFEAFYYLNQQEDETTYVQASRWIAFLCRKTQQYAAPPQRKENKKSRPKKATHSPSGIFEASRWPHVSKAPFNELDLSKS
nr:hypothetical protein CDL12_13650 [Ipomoea batatas]